MEDVHILCVDRCVVNVTSPVTREKGGTLGMRGVGLQALNPSLLSEVAIWVLNFDFLPLASTSSSRVFGYP